MENLVEKLARVRVVLVQPMYNGNLGQAARAMRNFGLSRLVLVGGEADPESNEARWYARAEGQPILDGAQRVDSLPAALADCRMVIGTSRRSGRDRGPAGGPEEVFAALRPWRSPWPTALVFGNETSGLASGDFDLCQHHILIPTDPGCPSLNLAHAVAVVGYVLARAVREDGGAAEAPAAAPPATHAVLEAMYAHARRVWVRIGYILTPDPDTMLRRWRRIFGRARLTESDARVVRALLHQTDWCAEVAGIPQGGAKDAPPGFFDKHRVRLESRPDERSEGATGGRGGGASGGRGNKRGE